MHVERMNPGPLTVNQLPDGSRVIVDQTNETVFALNAMAGAAWDACREPTTLTRVTDTMRRSFDPATTEGLAQEAILQLQDKNLVRTSESLPPATRRRFLATLGAAAVPLVVSLTIADQRAYAGIASSAKNQDGNSQGGNNNNQ